MDTFEQDELKMVQLHTMITQENEQMLFQLQGKLLMEKKGRISKGTIVNMALHEYLTIALDQNAK